MHPLQHTLYFVFLVVYFNIVPIYLVAAISRQGSNLPPTHPPLQKFCHSLIHWRFYAALLSSLSFQQSSDIHPDLSSLNLVTPLCVFFLCFFFFFAHPIYKMHIPHSNLDFFIIVIILLSLNIARLDSFLATSITLWSIESRCGHKIILGMQIVTPSSNPVSAHTEYTVVSTALG